MEKDDGLFISNDILDNELRDKAVMCSIILYKEKLMFDFFGLAKDLKLKSKWVDEKLRDTLGLEGHCKIEAQDNEEELSLITVKYIYMI